MIDGFPLWVVLLIGLGVFAAGFVDGIGGGGGIISVPVYLLAGLPAHFALGTNKMSSCIGTAVSTARYIKNVKMKYTASLANRIGGKNGVNYRKSESQSNRAAE